MSVFKKIFIFFFNITGDISVKLFFKQTIFADTSRKNMKENLSFHHSTTSWHGFHLVVVWVKKKMREKKNMCERN
jgi:hypothetical protein